MVQTMFCDNFTQLCLQILVIQLHPSTLKNNQDIISVMPL